MTAPVLITPYNPEWVRAFEGEAAVLREALGPAAIAVLHVGSTAVPGLEAKPIIDVLAIVRSLAEVDARREKLEAAGFTWRGEYGIPRRRYLVRPGSPQDRTHVHAFALGDPNVQRHLAFRDLLRADGELRDAYALLKRECASRFREDRSAYTEAKAPFIGAALARANRELFHITPHPPPIEPGPEGFVHLSNRLQVVRTANRFFRGRRGLLLVRLDPVGLDLRWEWNDGDLFPHVYETLPARAVTATWPFEPSPDGSFAFPG